MRKTILLCVAVLAVALGFVGQQPTSASTAFSDSFIARYGPALSAQFGCNVCHSRETIEQLNPYGRELGQAFAANGACLEFYPPNTHTATEGFCDYEHAPGLDTPYASGCTRCHGTDLGGLIAPSCYFCHGRRWSEAPPAGVAEGENGSGLGALNLNAAFAAIEWRDSDGDGFSNADEIVALTNPGDRRSYPAATAAVSASMPRKWSRDAATSYYTMSVVLSPQGGATIDTHSPVVLRTTAGELATMSFRLDEEETGEVEAFFPEALLYVLLEGIEDSRVAVVVNGRTDTGASFSTNVRVRLVGAAPALLENLALRANPREVGAGNITFTIRGADADRIDVDRPIRVIGTSGTATLEGVRRSGRSVTGRLDADTARELIGSPWLNGVVFTVGLAGWSTTSGTAFAVATELTTPSSDCYAFDTPRTHAVRMTVGPCVYLHKGGYEAPYANGCNACHGASLRGTSVTPSCYLCHGQVWNVFNAPAESAGR